MTCRCMPGFDDVRCTEHGAGGQYRPPVVLMADDTPPIVLRLPFVAPPITANQARSASMHWAPEHAAKRLVESAVIAVVKQARVPVLERVAITLTWYAPDYGRRDPDSLFPMLKAVIDALTPARPPKPKGSRTKAGKPREKSQPGKAGTGIIVDDHAGIVESTTTRILLGQPDPRIELRLDPLPGLPPPRRR